MSNNNTCKNKITFNLFAYKLYINKQDLVINNLQGMIYQKTTTSQPE